MSHLGHRDRARRATPRHTTTDEGSTPTRQAPRRTPEHKRRGEQAMPRARAGRRRPKRLAIDACARMCAQERGPHVLCRWHHMRAMTTFLSRALTRIAGGAEGRQPATANSRCTERGSSRRPRLPHFAREQPRTRLIQRPCARAVQDLHTPSCRTRSQKRRVHVPLGVRAHRPAGAPMPASQRATLSPA